MRELKKNAYVCPEDDFHVNGSNEYFEILFDNNEFEEMDPLMSATDPLNFKDTKKYSERIADGKRRLV